MSDTAYIIEIQTNDIGQRLDNYLIKHLKGVPKSHIYRIVRKGEVRINKKRCKVHQRLQKDDHLRIPPIRVSQKQSLSPSLSAQQYLAGAIIFEDEHVLILNKPAGWSVHAGTDTENGVIEVLKHSYENSDRDDVFIELVHRLDKETSGCLMVAKSRIALTNLQKQFLAHDGQLSKTYIALVKGQWQKGKTIVDTGLSLTVNRSKSKLNQIDEMGKVALSEFSPIKIFQQMSLMEVKISTGRMHQIRVHAAHLDFPVVGDRKYGDFEFNRIIKKAFGLNRMFLHASKLTFRHPIKHGPLTVKAPLPDDLTLIIDKLDNDWVNTLGNE